MCQCRRHGFNPWSRKFVRAVEQLSPCTTATEPAPRTLCSATRESPHIAMKTQLNQSILKEISPGYSLEGLMLKLKLQYFGHLMWRLTHWKRLWCWEGLGAGGEGDDRGWVGWMASPTRWTWVWVNSGSWRWIGSPGVLQFMGSQRVRHDWATELNWIEVRNK